MPGKSPQGRWRAIDFNPLSPLRTADYTTKIAGEVKTLDTDQYVAKKWVKRIDDVMKFMFVAGKQVGVGVWAPAAAAAVCLRRGGP